RQRCTSLRFGLLSAKRPVLLLLVWLFLFRLGAFLLPAEVLEVTFGHVAGGFRDALDLDGVGRFLGGLLDLADQFDARLFLERLTGGVAVEDFLALGIELSVLLGIKCIHLALLAVGPAGPAGLPATLSKVAVVLALTVT